MLLKRKSQPVWYVTSFYATFVMSAQLVLLDELNGFQRDLGYQELKI